MLTISQVILSIFRLGYGQQQQANDDTFIQQQQQRDQPIDSEPLASIARYDSNSAESTARRSTDSAAHSIDSEPLAPIEPTTTSISIDSEPPELAPIEVYIARQLTARTHQEPL
jgi:hypothetical protein